MKEPDTKLAQPDNVGKAYLTPMPALGWGGDIQARHAELVSASMARPLVRCRVEVDGRPWTLKQVQGDGGEMAASGRF